MQRPPRSPSSLQIAMRGGKEKLGAEQKNVAKLPTIVDLVALTNQAGSAAERELLGVEKMTPDGGKYVELYFDRHLSLHLDESAPSPEVQEILQGTYTGAQLLELFTEIRNKYLPAPGSEAAVLLERAVEDLRKDPGHFSDGAGAVKLLRDVGSDLRTSGRRLANSQIIDILRNTLQQYQIPFDHRIRRDVSGIIVDMRQNPEREINVRYFKALIRGIGEEIHINQHALYPHLTAVSMEPREAVRMPSDCMMHWITALRTAVKNTRHPARKAEYADILLEAKKRWLRHDMTFSSTRQYFEVTKENLIQAGAVELAELAGTLLSQIPGSHHDNAKLLGQWIRRLDKAAEDCADIVDRDQYNNFCKKAKDYLHQESVITSLGIGSFFKDAHSQLKAAGLMELADSAEHYLARVHGSQHDDLLLNKDDLKVKTLLHDNIYGRVFGTSLVKSLVEKPTEGVREAAQSMGKWLAQQIIVDPMEEEDRTRLQEIREKIKKTPRSWMAGVPAIQKLQGAGSFEDFVDSFGKFLKDEKITGFECIAVPYFIAVSFSDLPDGGRHAWLAKASYSYKHRIGPYRDRLNNLDDVPKEMKAEAERLAESGRIGEDEYKNKLKAEKVFRSFAKRMAPKVREGGNTLPHQPPVISESWMYPAMRPSTQSKPNFLHLSDTPDTNPALPASRIADNRLKETLRTMLAHGVAYATDLSGITNLYLYAVGDAIERSWGVDPVNASILNMMCLGYDGGHLPHEIFWVANAIDGEAPWQVDLELELGDSTQPEKFVFDYSWLCEGDDCEDMDDHLERAFDMTGKYLEDNSFYWGRQ